MPEAQEITRLLGSLEGGNQEALNELLPLVYGELQRIAHRQLGRGRPGATLNTTALVHEAYLKLVDARHANWQDRAHFFAVSARAMRQILLNYARQSRAQKRGGEWRRITLDEVSLAPVQRAEVLLALDEGLTVLASIDGRMSRVVELRFFGGLTEREIGHVIGVSERTVRREWREAKAWLVRFLNTRPETKEEGVSRSN